MNLDFNDAVISENKFPTVNYLTPGNHKVKVTKVEKGKSSQKQSPFVEITVSDEAGAVCAQRYYTNGGAWNISKSAILTIVAAALNSDEASAKSKLVGITEENIDVKLATLLVGKPFGIALNGEWVNPTDSEKSSYVKATFGSYKFAVTLADFDKLPKKPYIKGENLSASSSETPVSSNTGW